MEAAAVPVPKPFNCADVVESVHSRGRKACATPATRWSVGVASLFQTIHRVRALSFSVCDRCSVCFVQTHSCAHHLPLLRTLFLDSSNLCPYSSVLMNKIYLSNEKIPMEKTRWVCSPSQMESAPSVTRACCTTLTININVSVMQLHAST